MPFKTYPSGTVRALLETDLITAPTRRALQARLARQDVAQARFFDARSFVTLRAACARLIPQPERSQPIDIAGAIDERLADGEGDGWRYDTMPPDGEAHRRGLRGVNESASAMFDAAFHQLEAAKQDDVLRAIQRSEVHGGVWDTLPAGRFFEELLAGAAEAYYAHPLAQEEIGYVGMADATGWHAIGLNRLEAREPISVEEFHV